MNTKFLCFILILLVLAGCDKYYEGELVIENNTCKSILVRYQIDFNPNFNHDSVYQTIIDPYKTKSIYNDPGSLGMKCEEVRSTHEKIYFLIILSIANSSNDSCSKACNDCSEWKYETKIRENELDLITYKSALNEDDFRMEIPTP